MKVLMSYKQNINVFKSEVSSSFPEEPKSNTKNQTATEE